MSRSTTLVIAWIVFGLAVRWTFSPATIPPMAPVDHDTIDAVLIGFSRAHAWSTEATGSRDDHRSPVPSSVAETTAQLRRLGIRQLWWQAYDAEARVVVGVGPDGQPGTAGVDDGFNGRVDDRDELGATGTDDTFSVIPGDDWNSSQRPDAELRLATGAWVTHDRAGGDPIGAALQDHLVWANRPNPPSGTSGPRPRGRWIAVGERFERMIDLAH